MPDIAEVAAATSCPTCRALQVDLTHLCDGAGAMCVGREETAWLHARMTRLPHYASNVVGAEPGCGWPRII